MGSVERLSDRIGRQIEEVLSKRMAPADIVEWDLSVVSIYTQDEEGRIEEEPALSFYLMVDAPEVDESEGGRASAHLYLPMWQSHPDHVEWWVNGVWDAVSINRMALAFDK